MLRSLLRHTLLLRLGFITTALALLALFALLHLLGWRDDTAIISGTLPPAGDKTPILRGLLYALVYFAAVVVSPILLLAALIQTALRRLLPR